MLPADASMLSADEMVLQEGVPEKKPIPVNVAAILEHEPSCTPLPGKDNGKPGLRDVYGAHWFVPCRSSLVTALCSTRSPFLTWWFAPGLKRFLGSFCLEFPGPHV